MPPWRSSIRTIVNHASHLFACDGDYDDVWLGGACRDHPGRRSSVWPCAAARTNVIRRRVPIRRLHAAATIRGTMRELRRLACRQRRTRIFGRASPCRPSTRSPPPHKRRVNGQCLQPSICEVHAIINELRSLRRSPKVAARSQARLRKSYIYHDAILPDRTLRHVEFTRSSCCSAALGDVCRMTAYWTAQGLHRKNKV